MKKILLSLSILLCCCCSLWAQNDDFDQARQYFEEGAYEKAALVYEQLVREQPLSMDFLLGFIATKQQLEQYQEVEELLLSRMQRTSAFPQLLVDLGYNYQLQNKEEQAQTYYNKAIEAVRLDPIQAYQIGQSFKRYSLLDEAIETYTVAMEVSGKSNFNVQLAYIYGEQGNLDKMFDSYLELVDQNIQYLPNARRTFSYYVTEDPGHAANQLLRKALIKKLQTHQNPVYNELLSWLYVQQNEIDKAFVQEKAIFRRGGQNLSGIMDLAIIAVEMEAYQAAKPILEFVIEATYDAQLRLRAQLLQVDMDIALASPDDYEELRGRFENLLNTYGAHAQVLELQLAYADFMAYKEQRKTEAIAFLKSTLDQQLNPFEQARVKMKLADILVLDEKFNQALIYYSQIQDRLKNHVLAQEARFKVAKTSYYKGDFDWAQTQLKVLKSSATQLIANDALSLYLLIADNSQEDSTQAGLKKFAHADLLAYQQRPQEAITAFDQLLQEHKGESIEDEALLAQGRLFEQERAFAKAESNYQKILTYYGEDILADEAHFRLGLLYEKELNDIELAKEHFSAILFEFADSIYYVEAQRRFRALRGDTLAQPGVTNPLKT
ncbi:tetratricopeptide repeat protein [Croceiramulus getboli]|nr:tetratricopeptide repeat protein [Flavobacteriaceae bacterium YJPT1-3]